MVSKVAVITFLEPGETPPLPGHELPGQPAYPSHGLPGGGHPGNALPGGGHISLLPVFPFDPTRPDAGLPGEQPGPDNDLPRPGKKYVVKWLACQGLILVPDHSLPDTPEPK